MTLIEKRAASFKAAQTIVDAAKAGSRELTAEENAELEGHVADLKSLDAQIEHSQKSSATLAALKSLGSGAEEPVTAGPEGAKSLGGHAAVTIGENLKGQRGQKFSLRSPDFKAASDVHVRPSSVQAAITDIDTNVVTGVRRRLTVEDLLGSETISGTALTYFVEGALEGNYAFIAENAKKAQLHFGDPVAVTEALAKIAGFIKESDELIMDIPWLKSAIDGRLLYQLGLFTENALLSGAGTGGGIKGLLNRDGVQVEASAGVEDNADSIFRAITKTVSGSGLDADGIVINPADYQKLRLSKDGNGQYFGGGFFSGQYGQGGIQEQPPIWGLRTVVTPAIAAGTALVGAYAQAGSVISKGGISVEATNTDGEDFIHNRVTIRAERRLALAVRRPAGFVKVSLSDAPGP